MAAGRRPPVQTLPSYSKYVPVIAQLFTGLAKRGDVALALAPAPKEHEIYVGTRVPEVPIEDYLSRWARYSLCTPEVFLIVVLYVDKLSFKTGLVISSRNVHRVLLTALVLAAKTRDDIYYSNKYYASIGGITLEEMNRLEAQWLRDSDWDVHVDVEEYEKYAREFDRQKSMQLSRPSPRLYRGCNHEEDESREQLIQDGRRQHVSQGMSLCCSAHPDRD